MYAIKNTVQLVGNVIDDPVIRTSAEGKKLARFSLSIEDCYINSKGHRVKEVQTHSIVARGKVVGVVEKYLEKDMAVVVQGRLANRHFRDSQGRSRSVTEIEVNELLILEMQVQEDAGEYFVMATSG